MHLLDIMDPVSFGSPAPVLRVLMLPVCSHSAQSKSSLYNPDDTRIIT
jgi:hypothetical protein